MHPSEQNRQSNRQSNQQANHHPDAQSGDHDSGFPMSPEPAWLRPVKMAVVIMSVLIVVGIGLLFYGLAVNIGNLPSASDQTAVIRYPAGQTLIDSSMAADGAVILSFDDGKGGISLIRLSPDREEMDVILRLAPSDEIEFRLE
jgi:hypothetical protein